MDFSINIDGRMISFTFFGRENDYENGKHEMRAQNGSIMVSFAIIYWLTMIGHDRFHRSKSRWEIFTFR